MRQDGQGLRKNEGKNRLCLMPPFATEQEGLVYTYGANKYAERNWERGMKWSKVIDSLKRHLLSIENGEDFDKETGLLHAAHLRTNAGFLLEYYKIFPQGDDRPKQLFPKIGLDIDDVIADFVTAWCERFGVPRPKFWNFDYDSNKKFEELRTDKDFWMNIKPLINPEDIPFEPHCYITSRIIPVEWTMEWLYNNGFACVPVISLGHNVSKLEAVANSGAEIFVDDKYDTFVELNSNGYCCYLMTREHNKRYDVGFRRIESLADLKTLSHLRKEPK